MSMKFAILAAVAAAALAGPALADAAQDAAKVARVLKTTPLIDGHNDIAWEIRTDFGGDPARPKLALDAAAAGRTPPLQTDIPRLRRGGLGGQFWSVYVPAGGDGAEAVKTTLEQMTIVREMVALHPETFEMAYTADDVVRIHRAGRIASLMGMEGGHSIDNSLGVLRAMHQAGARYMTLTHGETNDWADSATDKARHDGLSPFGEAVVREMNRLGMIVDLSHVSDDTMRDALRVTRAPVIYSHSSARALSGVSRNVPDDVLALVKRNGGVVMVAFVPGFLSPDGKAWVDGLFAAMAEAARKHPGDSPGYEAAIAAWEAAHPAPAATLSMAADHIEHIAKVAGVDHVGLGGDFDGTSNLPKGLEDVSTYPALLQELSRRGWSEADLRKVAGENALRVMREVEATSRRLAAEPPAHDVLAKPPKG
jgi:membrane dipeptidase